MIDKTSKFHVVSRRLVHSGRPRANIKNHISADAFYTIAMSVGNTFWGAESIERDSLCTRKKCQLFKHIFESSKHQKQKFASG
jgi:hypothetical protein